MKRVITIVAAACLAAVCSAHEFWIQPATFRPAVGDVVGVHLRVGDGFPGETRPRDPTKLERFVVVGPEGESEVKGEDGVDPAGEARFESPGIHVLGYRGKASFIELDAAKFEAYLKEEGLEEIIALRKELGESDKSAREAYSRCCKSILSVGGDTTGAFERELGLMLELTPTVNPCTLSAGGSMSVRLEWDGKECGGATVRAFCLADPALRLTAVTNEMGVATLVLPRAGVWMLSAVQMKRGDGVKTDWESVWSSLTFEVGSQGK